MILVFTRTSDCLEIGNLKYRNDNDKTIPAVQFPCKTEQGDFEVMVLAIRFNSPITRLALEALYLSAIGQYSEEDLTQLCIDSLPNILGNDDLAVDILQSLRDLYIKDYEGTVLLQLKSETLSTVIQLLENDGNLIFSTSSDILHTRFVEAWDIINKDYLATIYGDKLDEVLSEVSNKDEYVGYRYRFFYPEDCFINNGYNYLSYINGLCGGAYDSYETLKHAYRTNEHFRDNPDFFNKTHCQCGGELVVRKTNGEYTLMSCINPYCYEKMAFCLSDFARAMGIDGLGATTLMAITKNIALMNLETKGTTKVTYRDLLKPSNEYLLGNAAGYLWLDFIKAIEDYKGTLKDLVSSMNLPYISSEASRILTSDILRNENLTPDDLMHACRRGGKYDIKFVLNLWLNIEDIRYVALTLAKSLNLNVVQEYLIYITKGVRLLLDDGRVISYTKKQFENLINESIANSGVDTVRIKVNGSLTHKCNVLIADQDRDTGSCRTAESYGIPILTSREFLLQLGGGSIG